MENNSFKTPAGEIFKGILKLKQAGFSEDEIFSVIEKIEEIAKLLLKYYYISKSGGEKSGEGIIISYNMVRDSIEEIFDGIILLRKAGFDDIDVLNDFLITIQESYDIFENDLFDGFLNNDYDDDDDNYEDDDDDDDDDDDFDPRKFFPKR